jgi:hypothetical protein
MVQGLTGAPRKEQVPSPSSGCTRPAQLLEQSYSKQKGAGWSPGPPPNAEHKKG